MLLGILSAPPDRKPQALIELMELDSSVVGGPASDTEEDVDSSTVAGFADMARLPFIATS